MDGTREEDWLKTTTNDWDGPVSGAKGGPERRDKFE